MVTSAVVSRVKALVGTTTTVQRSALHWKRPLRGAIVGGILCSITIAIGQPHMAIPLVVGAFFTGLADVAEPIGLHWRSMSWTALWLTVGTFCGGVSSRFGYEELFLVAIFAFFSGIAGVVGQRGGLNGMLALVMYAIFAGAPESPISNWQNTGLVALGGFVQVCAFVIPVLIFAPASLRSAHSNDLPFLTRLRAAFDVKDSFFRHAIRLSVAMVIATYLSDLLGWPHAYWIPMTVAWVSKPDREITDYRVVHRFIGTMAGLLVCTAVIEGFQLHSYGYSFLIAAGVFTCLVFVRSNYSISVIGVTMVVVGVFSLNGEPLRETLHYRTTATALGCLVAAIALFLWLEKTNDSQT